jgi:hypothetical protein
MKLETQFHLLLRLRKCVEPNLHPPSVHGTVLNTFAPRGVLVLRGVSRQLSGRSTSTPRFLKTC